MFYRLCHLSTDLYQTMHARHSVVVVAAVAVGNQSWGRIAGVGGMLAGVFEMQGCTIRLGRSGQSRYRPSAYRQAKIKTTNG